MSQLIPIQSVEIVTDNFCRHCGQRVGERDNFCSRCGTGAVDNALACRSSNSVGAVALAPSNDIQALLNNRLLIVGLIALVGPLGLPALWFSQRFSKITKIVTTVVYFVLTIVVPLAIAWYWLEYSIRPLVDGFPVG